MKPIVTIGICVRNGANTLQDTINSIACQDFPHEFMEVIFVDDGSEDYTLRLLCDNIPKMDMRTKLFHHKRQGIGASRNLVLKNAESDYIIWVDGDMSFSKDFVTKLVDFMTFNPQVGITKGKQSLKSDGNLLASLETCSRAVGRMVDYESSKGKLKSLGTGGAIYRVQAARQAGGFDEGLRGYGEDWDLEVRLRTAGWSLEQVDAEFSDYERYRLTWKSLWARYWRRGYYSHYFLHKNKGFLKVYNMFPVVAFFAGFFHARKLFVLTKRITVFFLPLEYVFKTCAWCSGFLESHASLYQPRKRNKISL